MQVVVYYVHPPDSTKEYKWLTANAKDLALYIVWATIAYVGNYNNNNLNFPILQILNTQTIRQKLIMFLKAEKDSRINENTVKKVETFI